ncbi:hypothetical protein [Paenibacillus vandeheii]|uniref:hypothetical protein n=1 Tax=Paenibacillus vandeheii TaxID=3035917 RepID=UPI00263BBBE8|nr:hypothetical protein [Paenibacillus vandeheii]
MTRIQFDQTVVGSLDTQPPVTHTKYINDALDSILSFIQKMVFFNVKKQWKSTGIE